MRRTWHELRVSPSPFPAMGLSPSPYTCRGGVLDSVLGFSRDTWRHEITLGNCQADCSLGISKTDVRASWRINWETQNSVCTWLPHR